VAWWGRERLTFDIVEDGERSLPGDAVDSGPGGVQTPGHHSGLDTFPVERLVAAEAAFAEVWNSALHVRLPGGCLTGAGLTLNPR